MAKFDPTPWVSVAFGLPAALIAGSKLRPTYDAWQDRRKARLIESAKQLLAKHEIETNLPGVVAGYPTIVSELGTIKEMVGHVLQELQAHATTDTAEFGSVRQEFAVVSKATEGLAGEVLGIKKAVAELTMTVESLADLRDYLKQATQQGPPA